MQLLGSAAEQRASMARLLHLLSRLHAVKADGAFLEGAPRRLLVKVGDRLLEEHSAVNVLLRWPVDLLLHLPDAFLSPIYDSFNFRLFLSLAVVFFEELEDGAATFGLLLDLALGQTPGFERFDLVELLLDAGTHFQHRVVLLLEARLLEDLVEKCRHGLVHLLVLIGHGQSQARRVALEKITCRDLPVVSLVV